MWYQEACTRVVQGNLFLRYNIYRLHNVGIERIAYLSVIQNYACWYIVDIFMRIYHHLQTTFDSLYITSYFDEMIIMIIMQK